MKATVFKSAAQARQHKAREEAARAEMLRHHHYVATDDELRIAGLEASRERIAAEVAELYA